MTSGRTGVVAAWSRYISSMRRNGSGRSELLGQRFKVEQLTLLDHRCQRGAAEHVPYCLIHLTPQRLRSAVTDVVAVVFVVDAGDRRYAAFKQLHDFQRCDLVR